MSGGDGRVFVYNVGAYLPEGGEMTEEPRYWWDPPEDPDPICGACGERVRPPLRMHIHDFADEWEPDDISRHSVVNRLLEIEGRGQSMGAKIARALRLTLPSLSPQLLQSVAECLGVEQDTEDR